MGNAKSKKIKKQIAPSQGPPPNEILEGFPITQETK